MRILAVSIALMTALGCANEAPLPPDRETTSSPRATATSVSEPDDRTSATPRRSAKPGFDVEAWRQRTIDRFGPEKTYQDGSKFDYVEAAYAICDEEDRPDYEEDSLQQYVVETFCPNV
jgi:hypothetical protein